MRSLFGIDKAAYNTWSGSTITATGAALTLKSLRDAKEKLMKPGIIKPLDNHVLDSMRYLMATSPFSFYRSSELEINQVENGFTVRHYGKTYVFTNWKSLLKFLSKVEFKSEAA